MKKIFVLISFTLLMGIVLMNSCKAPLTGNEEKNNSAVTDTINGLMSEITNYANQLNSDSTFKFLNADSSSVYMSGGMHYSYESLKTAFKNMYSGFKSQQISLIFSDVKVPAPGIAIWIGYMKGSFITKSDQVVEQFLCETWIWQRKPAGWKVIHYHESILRMPAQEQKKLVEVALGKLAGELGVPVLPMVASTGQGIADLRQAMHRVRAEVGKAVVGQDGTVTGLLIALLARGHVLLVRLGARRVDARVVGAQHAADVVHLDHSRRLVHADARHVGTTSETPEVGQAGAVFKAFHVGPHSRLPPQQTSL